MKPLEEAKAIVFYFSGTGNTEFASRLIKEKLELSGAEVELKAIDFIGEPDIEGYDALFLGYPVHGFGMPRLVKEFIERLPPSSSASAVVFSTYGGFSGGSERKAIAMLKDKGFGPISYLGLRMPANNPAGADISRQGVAELADAARSKVGRFFGELAGPRGADGIAEASGLAIGPWINPLYVSWAMGSYAKKAYADEGCSRCSLCVRMCPTGNISVVDGAIAFGKDCAGCLRCFNNCPSSAIQAGRGTIGAQRYKGPLGDYRYPLRPR